MTWRKDDAVAHKVLPVQHSWGNFIDATGFIDTQRNKSFINISDRWNLRVHL